MGLIVFMKTGRKHCDGASHCCPIGLLAFLFDRKSLHREKNSVCAYGLFNPYGFLGSRGDYILFDRRKAFFTGRNLGVLFLLFGSSIPSFDKEEKERRERGKNSYFFHSADLPYDSYSSFLFRLFHLHYRKVCQGDYLGCEKCGTGWCIYCWGRPSFWLVALDSFLVSTYWTSSHNDRKGSHAMDCDSPILSFLWNIC